MRVDGARDAVCDFDVELGDHVLYSKRDSSRSGDSLKQKEHNKHTRVDGSLADITNSGRLDHVPDGEPLDGLVLSHSPRAVRAADEDNMATSLLVTAAGTSLLGLHRT